MYRTELPKVFPHCYSVPLDRVSQFVKQLSRADTVYPNGSSFAVTVDAEPGRAHLWLSDASYARIRLDLP